METNPCSVDSNLTRTNLLGECDHGEGGGGAVLVLKVHNLIIAHIVVAIVRTPTVRTGPQSFHNVLDVRHISDHRHRPPCVSLENTVLRTAPVLP